MRQGGSFYLLHSDRNGSITAVTDNAGSLVGQQRYTAYGKMTQSGNFPTDRGYTGQIRDGSDASTLWDFYFYTSRYYNAAIGKFIEPDTIVPKASNPQALNRYAYALDNPLKLVDPSGHDPRQWLNEQWTSPTLSNEMQPGCPRRMGHAQGISPVTRRTDALTTRSGSAEWG